MLNICTEILLKEGTADVLTNSTREFRVIEEGGSHRKSSALSDEGFRISGKMNLYLLLG